MKQAVGQHTGKGWRITLGVIVGLLLIAGIACSGLLWALAAFLPAWQHPAEWTIAAAIGPFIGTALPSAPSMPGAWCRLRQRR